MRVAIIGSGPAGAACALALAHRGIKPVMLDAGMRLDRARAALVEKLAALAPAEWDAGDVARLRENPTVRRRGIPRKLVFGSDFIYASDHPAAPNKHDGVGASPTFAYSGYGAAWGGAMLPPDPADIYDWPVTPRDLEAGYRAALRELPLSAARDALEAHFPIYKSDARPLALKARAAALLEAIDRLRPREGEMVVAGRARLAVRAIDDDDGRGCRYCGLCLAGCVYGSIAGPSTIVERLRRQGMLQYRPGVVAKTVHDESNGVRVTCRSIDSSERFTERFDRVFVAAGAISTTRIMLESQDRLSQPVTLKDSQKFVLPFLRAPRFTLEWPNANTLADLFIEMRLASISAHWIHLQISSPNDYVFERMGILSPSFKRLFAMSAVERLMIAWCSLHSDVSSGLTLELSPTERGGERVLIVRNDVRPAAMKIMTKAAWAMARVGLRFGALFLVPLLQSSLPGAGMHTGASFPMRHSPAGTGETDVLGRPGGQGRVHLVDSSVFPSIPGTTIVLPLMANAYRIGASAPL